MRTEDRAALLAAVTDEGATPEFAVRMSEFIGNEPLTYDSVRRAAKQAGYTWGDVASKIASHFEDGSTVESPPPLGGAEVLAPAAKPAKRKYTKRKRKHP